MAQNWIPYSRCNLVSAEQRRIIPSFTPLFVLLLAQPRMQLAIPAAKALYWLRLTPLHTRTPSISPAELPPGSQAWIADRSPPFPGPWCSCWHIPSACYQPSEWQPCPRAGLFPAVHDLQTW